MQNSIIDRLWRVNPIFLLFFTPAIFAEVVLDGSLGQTGAVTGPDFAITESMGQTSGSNLFQSFSEFNLSSSESATFSGSAGITNIISRVTGDNASMIDGTITSTIDGANFYFVNPSGIIFGENAQLNVRASFYASTADYLSLGNDGRFDVTQTANSVFTASAPASFGFLDTSEGSIAIYGANLSVPVGEGLNLVANEILVSGNADSVNNLNGSRASLAAESGDVSLLAVGSGTDVTIDKSSYDTSGAKYTGNLIIESADISSSGDNAGTVYIRGGNLVVQDNAVIESTYTGIISTARVGIDVNIKNTIDLRTSTLKTNATLSGYGGDINMRFRNLNILDGANVRVESNGAQSTAGALSLYGRDVLVSGVDESLVEQSPGGPELMTQSSILSLSGMTGGAGGNILVDVVSLSIADGGQINSSTRGAGDAGDITVRVQKFSVSGFSQNYKDYIDNNNFDSLSVMPSASSSLTSRSVEYMGNETTGNAGAISITSRRFNLSDSAEISTLANSTGSVARIYIFSGDSVILSNATIKTDAKNATSTNGRINIFTDEFDSNSSLISTRTTTAGASGKIDIEAASVKITGSTFSTYQDTTAIVAGDIIIDSASDLIIESSTFTTSTEALHGGDISLEATDITLINNTTLDVMGRTAKHGGNISVNSDTIILNRSNLVATAEGDGGNIAFNSNFYLESGNNSFDVTSQFGNDGAVTINSARNKLGNELVELPEVNKDASEFFRNECVLVGSGVSNFVVAKRQETSKGSRNVLSSRYSDTKAKNSNVEDNASTEYAGKSTAPKLPLLILSKNGSDCMHVGNI